MIARLRAWRRDRRRVRLRAPRGAILAVLNRADPRALSVIQLVEQTGLSARQIFAAARTLADDGMIKGAGKGRSGACYQLTDDGREPSRW